MYDTFPVMTLFCILGMPLFTVFFLVFAYTNAFDPKMVFREAGKGLVCFFPAVVAYLVVDALFPTAYEGPMLYLTRTVLDLLAPMILSAASYFVIYRKEIIVPGEYQVLRFLSFGTGFFAAFAFFRMVNFQGWYEGYQYLLLPLLWMSVLLAAGYALAVFFSQGGLPRFVFLLAALALPFVLGFIPYLYIASRYFFAWTLSIAAFGGFFFLFRKALPHLK